MLYFDGNTQIATPDGWCPLSVVAQEPPVTFPGKSCVKLKLGVPSTNRVSVSFSILCHKDQKFLHRGEKTVSSVAIKRACLWSNPKDFGYDRLAWLTGFLRGAGYSGGSVKFSRESSRYRHAVLDLLELPEAAHIKAGSLCYPTPSFEAIGSFVKGLVSSRASRRQLTFSNRKLAEYLFHYACYGGFVISGGIVEGKTFIKGRAEPLVSHRVCVRSGRDWPGWQIKELTIPKEEVLLYPLPGSWAMLQSGLLVGNCRDRITFASEAFA